jgi:methionyl aminopeptidase
MLLARQQPGIQIKSRAELEGMRRAGKLASQALGELLAAARPGITTLDIDDLSMAFCKRHGVKPAQLGFHGFPRSVCTSVNQVVCHGIPSRKVVLADGDIICIDVTLIVDGYFADTAATVAVGEVDADSTALMYASLDALKAAAATVKNGSRLGDVGAAVQRVVEPRGYSIVRDYVGHGIGREFHEPPQVSAVGTAGTGVRLRTGMTFTIEPMINAGTWRCKVLDDQWTVVTLDGKRSAQYEHTLAVTDEGVEVLTQQSGNGEWENPGRCVLPERPTPP